MTNQKDKPVSKDTEIVNVKYDGNNVAMIPLKDLLVAVEPYLAEARREEKNKTIEKIYKELSDCDCHQTRAYIITVYHWHEVTNSLQEETYDPHTRRKTSD